MEGIAEVRIGGWRVLTANAMLRLKEVRERSYRRVAGRLKQSEGEAGRLAREIWQLDDLEGGLEASLQTAPGGRIATCDDFRRRHA
jgi:hypothetical protein